MNDINGLIATSARLTDKDKAITYVKEILAGDDKPVIYTISRRTRSAGQNGTSADLSLFYLKGSAAWNLTYYAGLIIGLKVKNLDGYNIINNTGGGMDLGFDLVYALSSYLYEGEHRAGYKVSHRWL
jgi:hypothetical protein